MPKKPPRPLRRFIKLCFIVFGVIAFVILGLHIWFVHNARSLLKEIVATKSHHKLKLELSQLSFNVLSNKLQVKQANLLSADSVSQPSTYQIKFQKLTLHVGSFWSLLFQKNLSLDSIKLHNPVIEVMKWRKDTSSAIAKDELSISQEMGRLYNSMLDGLEAFGIRRINIDNAKLRLVNKMKPRSQPIIISNIYFNLVRTAKNVNKRDEFIENEQTVDLSTTDQDISFPSGRHRLSFRSLNLHLFNKRIELDSCTLTAIAKDSLKSSYRIFFNKLLLTGVDFGAMYRNKLIRADSVYCENPLFDIDLNPSDAAAKRKKERPDPEKIIRELAGDLDFAFVEVKDAGIHIIISGKNKRSLFNSNKDDFEMRGLRINPDSSQPVVVDRFDMLVRDYHLYNEDSSTAYTFDSIHFHNNKIVLNSFSVITSSSQNRLRNERDFKIPYFELTGLDWYQLIFEDNLLAREAVLYNPVINYTKRTKNIQRKKTNLFGSLQTLDNLLTLDRLKIINGQVNMNLGAEGSINLKNVNLDLFSNQLLQSKNRERLGRAFKLLSFSSGIIRVRDIMANLQNVHHTENHLLHADKINITSVSKKVKADVHDVYLNNLLLDEKTGSVVIDGLQWHDATVDIQSLSVPKTKGRQNLSLQNISGNNTRFNFTNGKTAISSFIQSVRLASLNKKVNGPVQTGGIIITGKDLGIKRGGMKINASSYQISDERPSYLSDLDIERIEQKDSLYVSSPRVNFSANVNDFMKNDFHINNVEMVNPVIKISRIQTSQDTNAQKSLIRIDHLMMREADIYFSTHLKDSVTIFQLPWSAKSIIKAGGLKIDGESIEIGDLSINTTAATLIKRTGERIGVEKGKIDMELSGIQLSKKDGKASWNFLVNSFDLENPNSFAIGKKKNKLQFEQASFGNVKLSSEYIFNFDKLVRFNISAWLRTTTGQYIDTTATLKWYNAAYNSDNKTLSLDSFMYYPTQPRDSVINYTAYQTDYITFQSGPVNLTGFNLEKYEKDSSLIANTMEITKPVITVYRDKQPPLLEGIIKPLPVDMIKKIPLPVSIQKVRFIDGTMSYTEKNAKTRAEGTFIFAHLHGQLANLKNRNLIENDSLSLTVNTYLMDSTLLHVIIKESYTDTLSGFLMTMRLKPTTLTFLNPVLVPLSNVKIVSGTIDSFHLRAIGQENLSIGEMKMYYHNLRIKIIKNGEENRSNLVLNVASFIANTFIIKKNNNGRTGLIYFERFRDRSFFNYIAKMTFSGMATSIGVKKNRKYIRQYKRELSQRNLPPIVFE